MDNNSNINDQTDNTDAEQDNKIPGKKKRKINSIYFLWGLTGFLTVAACMLFSFILNHSDKITTGFNAFNKVMMPVYWALIIAYLLTPVLNLIEQKIVIPIFKKITKKEPERFNKTIRGISIFLTMIFALAILIGIIFLMISQIVPSIGSLVENFDTYATNFQLWVKNTLKNNPNLMNFIIDMSGTSSEQLEEWLTGNIWSGISKLLPFFSSSGTIEWSQISNLLGTIIGGVGKVLGGIWNFIIGMIIAVYLLGGKEKFAGRSKKLTYAIFPKYTSNEIIHCVRFCHKTFIGFFGGKIIDSLIIGILCFIGTTILQTPYAALISIFVGVTNIIPYFGPFIGAIPSAVLVFLVDPMHPLNVILFVIFILVLQQIDGNVIGPKILGDSTGLEGFWVIFAITVFGGFFGILGMIFGVPLFAIIYAGLKTLAAKSLNKKKLSTVSMEYVDVISIDDEGNITKYDSINDPYHKKNNKTNKPGFFSKIINKVKDKKNTENKNKENSKPADNTGNNKSKSTGKKKK